MREQSTKDHAIKGDVLMKPGGRMALVTAVTLFMAFVALVLVAGSGSAVTLRDEHVGLDKVALEWSRYRGDDFKRYEVYRDPLPEDLSEGNHTITVNASLETGESAEKEATVKSENESDDDDENKIEPSIIMSAVLVVVLIVVVMMLSLLRKVFTLPDEAGEDTKEEEDLTAASPTPDLTPLDSISTRGTGDEIGGSGVAPLETVSEEEPEEEPVPGETGGEPAEKEKSGGEDPKQEKSGEETRDTE